MDEPLTGITRRQRREVMQAAIITLDLIADVATSQQPVSAKIDILDAAYRMVHDFEEGLTRSTALIILNFHLHRLSILESEDEFAGLGL